MEKKRQTGKFNGKWISAPKQWLKSLENFPEKISEKGKWIWPKAYVRGHIRREFTLNELPIEARLEFWCDNKIDVYINGKAVIEGEKRVVSTEISCYLIEEKNYIAIRVYQTDSPLHYVSALKGYLTCTYNDGHKEEIVTDEKWHAYGICSFYEETEPIEWTRTEGIITITEGERDLLCFDIHPRLLRRSCLFRKTVEITGQVKDIFWNGTAHGVYEVWINGEKANDDMLAPGAQNKYQEYQKYRITEHFTDGKNTIILWVGNGWYNCSSWGELDAKCPEILGEIEIIYEDGKKERIVTDQNWKVNSSPLLDNDIQFGERYDGRIRITPWNYESEEEKWVYAIARNISEEDQKKLVLQSYPPIRKIKVENPVSIKHISKGEWLIDFGINLAGRCRVEITSGKEGSLVYLEYGERLDENGNPWIGPYVDVFFPHDNFPEGKAPFLRRNLDVYICAGDEKEVYEPRFTYTGFRYLKVSCETASLLKAEKMIMHTDLKVTGAVTSSYELISTIWEMTTRSFCSNIFSGPTDCPSREKNFWNGDIQAFSHAACWYMDCDAFLSTWTDGGRKMEYNCYGWEDEEYILPLVLYQFYGNTNVIKNKYPVVKQLLQERRKKMGERILPFSMRAPYRDHLAVENNMSSDYFAAAFFCYNLKMLGKMAHILGENEEEKLFLHEFEKANKAFLETWFNSDNGDMGQKCEGGQVLALTLELIPKEKEKIVMDRLIYYIKKADYHLTTGFLTTLPMFGLLCDFGYADIAWQMFCVKTYPSWNYMIQTGATTITETWKGITEDDPWGSLNHFALGSICSWFFEYLGGIRINESDAGLNKIKLKPVFIEEIKQFGIQYKTRNGILESKWSFKNEKAEWSLHIPEGIVAEIYLPGSPKIEKMGGDYILNIDAVKDAYQMVLKK